MGYVFYEVTSWAPEKGLLTQQPPVCLVCKVSLVGLCQVGRESVSGALLAVLRRFKYEPKCHISVEPIASVGSSAGKHWRGDSQLAKSITEGWST